MAKYPEIKVKLAGEDGNAFAIMGRVSDGLRKGLKKRGMTYEQINEEISAFRKQAMSGDYNNLLCTCMDWVKVR
jgi:hypothetical protein